MTILYPNKAAAEMLADLKTPVVVAFLQQKQN